MSTRSLALGLAGATAATLVAMAIVSIATGATQEAHEHIRPAADYTRGLLEHPGALRLVFGLDIAFCVLYTGFFAALARYLRLIDRPYAWLAFGAMMVTTALDLVEDHHILALLARAEAGAIIDDGAIALQDVISAVKFSASYVALFLFGMAIPRTTRLGWALALFLSVGTLITGVIGIAAPAAARAQVEGGRAFGFLIGFALAAAWLRRAPDAD